MVTLWNGVGWTRIESVLSEVVSLLCGIVLCYAARRLAFSVLGKDALVRNAMFDSLLERFINPVDRHQRPSVKKSTT